MPTPQVLLGAQARAQLKNGLDLLAQVISLTLGPRAGGVALERVAKGPEVLTSSAMIARRIVEIPGRGANVGLVGRCREGDEIIRVEDVHGSWSDIGAEVSSVNAYNPVRAEAS